MISAVTVPNEIHLLSDEDLQKVGITVLKQLAKKKMLKVFDIGTKSFMDAGKNLDDEPEKWLAVCTNQLAVQINCDTRTGA